MSAGRILVVDDEEDILELVRYNLAAEGYRVLCAATGEEALAAVRSQRPELILLDLMLPGIDGMTVARRLRADPETRALPIIMLTARGEEMDVIGGFESGADDYITKPFSPRILLARVRAAMRRKAEGGGSGDFIRIGDLCLDVPRRTATAGDAPVDLTYTEFEVLLFLARRPGWAFSRARIVDAVHGDSHPVTERSVDVQIAGLRKKLGDRGGCIETVRGVGYRIREPSLDNEKRSGPRR